jgi:hypothetical protein
MGKTIINFLIFNDVMQRQIQKAQHPPVFIKNGNLIIKDVTIDDEEVVSYFKDVPEHVRLERLEEALAVGTVALKTMGTYEKIDLVEKKFKDMAYKFDRSLKDALDKMKEEVNDKFGQRGQVKALVDQYFSKNGEIPRLICEHFGEGGKLAQIFNAKFGQEGELKRIVDSYFGENGQLKHTIEAYFGEKGKFAEQVEKYIGDKGKLMDILDVNKKDSPLYNLMQEIKEENEKLRKDIIKQTGVQEMLLKSPQKGVDFEEDCYSMLCAIAKREHPPDEVQDVSKTISRTIHGSKKGDFNIILGQNPNLKIVVDAKSHSTQLTLPQIKETLSTALRARDAQYGILVVKDINSLPQFLGYFNELGEDMLVCALSNKSMEINFEILDIAYRWAKLRILQKMASTSRKINEVEVKQDLGQLKSELAGFTRILSLCDDIDRTTDKIRVQIKSLKRSLERGIQTLLDGLS